MTTLQILSLSLPTAGEAQDGVWLPAEPLGPFWKPKTATPMAPTALPTRSTGPSGDGRLKAWKVSLP